MPFATWWRGDPLPKISCPFPDSARAPPLVEARASDQPAEDPVLPLQGGRRVYVGRTCRRAGRAWLASPQIGRH